MKDNETELRKRTAADRCYRCRRSLNTVAADAVETTRESVGFGAGNDRTRTFCGARCRCLWAEIDPVIDATRQTRVTAWRAGGIDLNGPDAIAWGR